MNMTLRNVGLALGLIALSSTVNAQKTKVTSAAVEYQKFESLFSQQKLEDAQAALITAKGFIDDAAVHPDTKEDDKTYLYVGKIYGSLAIVEILTKGENADEAAIMKNIETSLQAYKVGYATGKKYKVDIKEAATNMAGLMSFSANGAYEEKMYEDAGEAYEIGSRYFDAIGILDSAMIYNAALCYENAEKFDKAAVQYEKLAAVNYQDAKSAVRAAYCYKQMKDFDGAKRVIAMARKTYPYDKDLLTQLVNISLDEGDDAGAKQALDDAIAADPTNKALHYIIGTIYMNMKDNAAAEKSLLEALSIDPSYVNAQYQLGAHLFNWASQLKEEASFLKVGDPREEELLNDADKKMEDAIKYLEMYIENEPNDKAVLNILYKAHHKQGNTEKAATFKARYDAL